MMETRLLGRTGTRIGVIGICPGQSRERDAVIHRARELGCSILESGRPPQGAEMVRYNLLDQKPANEEIQRLSRAGHGVVAVHVLAGGALAGGAGHPYGRRVQMLQCLVKPGRTLVQAAIQFVLANESVNAAAIRVSTVGHLEEAVRALEATPLNGQDLEQIFEQWANRFE